jgi:hypothetical protein
MSQPNLNPPSLFPSFTTNTAAQPQAPVPSAPNNVVSLGTLNVIGVGHQLAGPTPIHRFYQLQPLAGTGMVPYSAPPPPTMPARPTVPLLSPLPAHLSILHAGGAHRVTTGARQDVNANNALALPTPPALQNAEPTKAATWEKLALSEAQQAASLCEANPTFRNVKDFVSAAKHFSYGGQAWLTYLFKCMQRIFDQLVQKPVALTADQSSQLHAESNDLAVAMCSGVLRALKQQRKYDATHEGVGPFEDAKAYSEGIRGALRSGKLHREFIQGLVDGAVRRVTIEPLHLLADKVGGLSDTYKRQILLSFPTREELAVRNQINAPAGGRALQVAGKRPPPAGDNVPPAKRARLEAAGTPGQNVPATTNTMTATATTTITTTTTADAPLAPPPRHQNVALARNLPSPPPMLINAAPVPATATAPVPALGNAHPLSGPLDASTLPDGTAAHFDMANRYLDGETDFEGEIDPETGRPIFDANVVEKSIYDDFYG